MRLLLHRRQFIESVAEQVGLDDFRDDRLASIFRGLVEAPDGGADALAAMLDEDGVALLDELTTSAGGLDVPARIIQDCVAGLRQRKLGEEIDAIDRRIPLADDAEKDRLVGIKQKLTTEMHALGGRRWKSFGGRAR